MRKDPLEGHRCFVLKQGQFLSDVAEYLVDSWWMKTQQDGPAICQKHCVGRKSLFLVQGLGCCEQSVGFSSAICWLLPCSHRLPDESAVVELDEHLRHFLFFKIYLFIHLFYFIVCLFVCLFVVVVCCLFCWPICVSSCPGGRWVGYTKGFQGQWPQLFICVVRCSLAWMPGMCKMMVGVSACQSS